MRMTERAHEVVRQIVARGDTAVDATVGNGHDTLFLARRVGEEGTVIGFDVQAEALRSARDRLERFGVARDRVRLIQAGHEAMKDSVPEGPAAVMFNLGYLPGGDHGLITKKESTVMALAQAWELLREGGVISVVCYRGHPGGRAEGEAVCEWARGLNSARVLVEGADETEAGPFLVAVWKLAPQASADGGPERSA